jgi:NAD(P)-dependent dehydrogenase (short-subunit alcohol dehydrogenase family)
MDKTVFITGAATGIGLAVARKLLDLGWQVFAGIMPGQDQTALQTGKPAGLTVVLVDITSEASVKSAAGVVARMVGKNGLYGLVNNAGVAHIGSGVVAGVDIEEARALFDINVFGTLRVTQAFLPLLHWYGAARIVNMSSGAVRVPVPTAAVYNMSKCAIEGLTKTLRYELAPFGISVTAVEPGGVRTPMTANAEANLERVWSQMPAEVRARYETALRPANKNLVKALEKANPPELIAERVVFALTTKRPQPRYTAGKEVRLLPLIQKLLPETTFENLLLREFGLKKGSETRRGATP